MTAKTEKEKFSIAPSEVAVTKKTTELAELHLNPFEQYGSEASQQNIRGRLLKFSKGDWLAGPDEDELAEGTKLVANMDELVLGWIKWVDNRPDQQIMGHLKEAYRPPKRDELGDTDESQWQVDASGKPRDPWQFTNYLIMKDVGTDGGDDDNLYTFTTNSKGGLSCVGGLCKEYGKAMSMRPDEYPVVEIGVESYKHPNPEFGRIKKPTFKIVGWEKKETFGTR